MKIREKHVVFLRILHWLNIPFLVLMVWSGLLIYWANDVYPGFFPQWFYEHLGIEARLAEGLWIHFTVGWLFVVNGLIYLIWFFTSGHWREIFPNRESLRWFWPTLSHDLGLGSPPPPAAKFNAVQRVAYTSVLFVAVVAVLTGFAIYKPVQLGWLKSLLGGYSAARLLHFAAMLFFCVFALLHVIQVVRAGWNNFRSMVAGYEVENE